MLLGLKSGCGDKGSRVLKTGISFHCMVAVAFIDFNAGSVYKKPCQFEQEVYEWLKKFFLLL